MSLWAVGVGQFNENIAFSVDPLRIVAVEVRISCVLVLFAEVHWNMADGFLVRVCTSLSKRLVIVAEELLFA